MSSKVEVIAHSIGPSGIEIFTCLCEYWRGIHAEVLRSRNVSHSVASSRALKTSLIEQVKNNPYIPVYFPKRHKGMQSNEVCEPGSKEEADAKYDWLSARDKAADMATRLEEQGISNQIYNRLVEPFVVCRDVMTFTRPQIESMFLLRHPWHWHYEDGRKEGNYRVWEDKVNLTFPTEYNFQDLSIKLRKAIMSSSPKVLEAGEWHLPFITDEDRLNAPQSYADVWNNTSLINLSSARCAMTSYSTNKGRSLEQELDLANRLIKENHWSPFEHQAQALSEDYRDYTTDAPKLNMELPKGLEARITNSVSNPGMFDVDFYSRNLKGYIQARALLDGDS